jgi:hypothetical protein
MQELELLRRQKPRFRFGLPVHRYVRAGFQESPDDAAFQYRAHSAHHPVDRRMRPAIRQAVLAQLLERIRVGDRRDRIVPDARLQPAQQLAVAFAGAL